MTLTRTVLTTSPVPAHWNCDVDAYAYGDDNYNDYVAEMMTMTMIMVGWCLPSSAYKGVWHQMKCGPLCQVK